MNLQRQTKKRTTISIKRGKDRINWPPANSREWQRLDTDITRLLETLYSPAIKKTESHPQTIYAICKERFEAKEKEKNTEGSSTGPSRRRRKCKELRENRKIDNCIPKGTRRGKRDNFRITQGETDKSSAYK